MARSWGYSGAQFYEDGTEEWGYVVQLSEDQASGAEVLTADAGSYSVTGTAAGLEYHRLISAAAGNFTWTGTAATLKKGVTLTAESAAFTWTGTAAGLEHHRLVTAEGGVFTVTGTAAGLEYHRVLAAAAGGYTWTGSDATLTKSGGGAEVLTAESGSFSVAGTAAGLEHHRALNAESGSFTWTGTVALPRASFITFVGAVTGGDSAANDIVLDLTSLALQERDVVYIIVTAPFTTGLSAPTGYTKLNQWSYLALDFAIHRKVQTSTPDTSVTVDVTFRPSDRAAVAIAVAFRGADWNEPEDQDLPSIGFATGGQPNSPAITTQTDNAAVLSVFGIDGFDSTATPPSGYGDATVKAQSDTTQSVSSGFSWKTVATASTEDPAAWSGLSGTTEWLAQTIAVRVYAGARLVAASGTFTVTGTAADLLVARLPLTADSGAFTWTGTAGNLEHHRLLSAAAGVYTWTGTDVNLFKGISFSVDSGAFTWTGTAATLLKGIAIAAESGSFTITSPGATLTYDTTILNWITSSADGAGAWSAESALTGTWTPEDSIDGGWTEESTP